MDYRRYTTWGPVRGQGPTRTQRDRAEADLRRDQRDCANARGYSDRRVYGIDDEGFLRTGDGEYAWPSHGRSCGAVRAK